MLLDKYGKSCPFCKTEMVRPRKGFCIGDSGTPLFTFPCPSFHKDESKCSYCKYYFDYECPDCGI